MEWRVDGRSHRRKGCSRATSRAAAAASRQKVKWVRLLANNSNDGGRDVRTRAPERVEVTDWNLNEAGQPGAVGHASRLGFSGLQITLGDDPNKASLPLNDPELQRQYLVAAQREQIVVDGTCIAMDLEPRFLNASVLPCAGSVT